VLLQSNKDIILNHLSGVALLRNTVEKLKRNSSPTLLEVYRSNLSSEEEELSK
jgi:hypothetical protein